MSCLNVNGPARFRFGHPRDERLAEVGMRLSKGTKPRQSQVVVIRGAVARRENGQPPDSSRSPSKRADARPIRPSGTISSVNARCRESRVTCLRHPEGAHRE